MENKQEYDYSQTQVSYDVAGDLEDTSYGNVKRVSWRIVIPLGRSRPELRATLEKAARDLAAQTNANAAMVFAYRPEDSPSGAYSVGRAIIAPNGRWEDASSSAEMEIQVDMNELYFAPPARIISTGEIVHLLSDDGDKIEISNSYGSWMPEDIVGEASAGVSATIVARKSEPMGDSEFVRYQIKVTVDGRDIIGWVHQSSIEE